MYGAFGSESDFYSQLTRQYEITTWLVIIIMICIVIIVIQYVVYVLRRGEDKKAKTTTGLKIYKPQPQSSHEKPQQPLTRMQPQGIDAYPYYRREYSYQQPLQYQPTQAYSQQFSKYSLYDANPYHYDPYQADPMRYDPFTLGRSGIRCLNCGAEIEITTTICPYCQIEIRKKRHAF